MLSPLLYFYSGSEVAVIDKFSKIRPPQNIIEDGWKENRSYYASPIRLDPEMNPVGLCVSGTFSFGLPKEFGVAVSSAENIIAKDMFSVDGGHDSGSFIYNLLNFGVKSSGEHSIIVACPQGLSPKKNNLSVGIRRNVRIANSTIVTAGWTILGLGVLLTVFLSVITGNVSRG